MRRTFSTVLSLALGLTACETSRDLPTPVARAVEVPAGPGSSLPHVATAGGGAILSWVVPADTGHALQFAKWDGSGWTEPRTVASGTNWFVNWADFPSVIELSDGELAAHWLQRSAEGTYAYDVMISRSHDRGMTWTPGIRPHTDGTPTEHGFVSMFAVDGELGVVWLDGRKFADDGQPASNEMTVRFATLQDGAPAMEHVLDERACDCCQTDVAMTSKGPLVVYRDRSEREIRDISVTRLLDGRWTEPRRVHEDGWQIDACPVNGPQTDAQGDAVAVAWFTAAADTPRVRVAFSSDAGETFAAPVRVDGGNPVGRVDVLLLRDDRALVVWLERSATGGEIMARIVTSDGRSSEPARVADTLAERPSGFPRIDRYGDGVLLAWTEPGDSSHVRAAAIAIDDIDVAAASSTR